MLDFARHIVEQSERLTALVSNLRLLSVPATQDAAARRAELGAVLVRVTSLLDFRLRKAAATLRTQIAPDLPLLVISTHALEQILINLLGNALDAIAGIAHPVVQVRARVLAENPRFAIIEVADNGSGIAKTIRHRLFSPSSRRRARNRGPASGSPSAARSPALRAAISSCSTTPGPGASPRTPSSASPSPSLRSSSHALRNRGVGAVSRLASGHARSPCDRDAGDAHAAGHRHADAGPVHAAARHRRRGRGRARRPGTRCRVVHAHPRAGQRRDAGDAARGGPAGALHRALPAAARALPAGRPAGRRAGERHAPLARRRPHRAGRLDRRPLPHQSRRHRDDAGRGSQLRAGDRRSPGARRDPDPRAAGRSRRRRPRRRPQRRRARDGGGPAAGAVPARAGARARHAGRRQLLRDRVARRRAGRHAGGAEPADAGRVRGAPPPARRGRGRARRVSCSRRRAASAAARWR